MSKEKESILVNGKWMTKVRLEDIHPEDILDTSLFVGVQKLTALHNKYKDTYSLLDFEPEYYDDYTTYALYGCREETTKEADKRKTKTSLKKKEIVKRIEKLEQQLSELKKAD